MCDHTPEFTNLSERLNRHPSTRHLPRHRRVDVERLTLMTPDPDSQAKCECLNGNVWRCPRHSARGYAEVLARHATDSI